MGVGGDRGDPGADDRALGDGRGLVFSAWDYDLAAGLLGEKGSRLTTRLLMGAPALVSGLLVLHHRRGDGDGYWTGADLVYVLALFFSLLYGSYSFFGGFFRA